MKQTLEQKRILLDSCVIQDALTNRKLCEKNKRTLQKINAQFFISARSISELRKNLGYTKEKLLQKIAEKLGIQITIHYSTIAEKNWQKQNDVKFLCHYEDRPILASARFQNFVLLTADKTLRNISNHFGVRAFHPFNGGLA